MADFPGSIFSGRTVENMPGVTYDAANKRVIFAEDYNTLADEINAIESVLLDLEHNPIEWDPVFRSWLATFDPVTSFLDLSDTPSSYSGQSLKAVRVNTGETALEFYTPPAGADEKVAVDASQTPVYLMDALLPTAGNIKIWKVGSTPNKQIQFDLDFDFDTRVSANVDVYRGLWEGEYGAAIDGSLTISVDTVATSDLDFEDLTIASGKKLDMQNFVLRVRGTLTNNGTIHSNGQAGQAAGAGGTATAAHTIGGGGNGGNADAPGSSTTNSLGAPGGNGGAAGPPGGFGGAITNPALNDGGVRIGYHLPEAIRGRDLNNVKFTGGAGGGGGTSDHAIPPNKGGGGGAGGGVLIVAACRIALLGNLQARGGDGHAAVAGNTGGGGGGGGGIVVLITKENPLAVTTVDANGGAGGGGFGTGSAGANGSNGRVAIIFN